MRIQNFDKGVSLYLALMIMAVLLAMALGVSTILLGQSKMITGIGHSVLAFYAADTGIERTLYAIHINDLQQTYSGQADGASYSVKLVCGSDYAECPSPLVNDPDCSASYYCVKSVGEYKETRRGIQVMK